MDSICCVYTDFSLFFFTIAIMSSSVKESKKRKLDDADEQKQGRSKRQLIQNTLQYFFSKTAVKTTTQKDSCDDIVDSVPTEAEKIESTTCPMCSTTFENVIIAQYESHVNSCLDTADASSSDTIKQQVDPIPKPNQETASISWSKIFTAATFKIRGIWSHHKNDTAPGLNESETSWFGEPKYSSTTTATIPRRRLVPYYKRLAGTKMVVDAFTFGEIPDCEGYLLSHFHSDHYMGLSPNWIHGPIYCSEITARLVEQKLGVASDFIFPLPMNTPCTLPGTDQLTVTLMDANHCPGAVLFLVTTKDNLRYLHTGDFRACPKMCLHPMLKEQPLDIVYLDTTYLDPKYSFPSQDSCIQTACELVRRHNGVINNEDLSSNGKRIDHWFTQEKKQISSDHSTQHTDDSSDKNHRLLVVVGTYSLGKENIFIGNACGHAVARVETHLFFCRNCKDVGQQNICDRSETGHSGNISWPGTERIANRSVQRSASACHSIGPHPSRGIYPPQHDTPTTHHPSNYIEPRGLLS